jgi:thioredoxin-like negative regulator of GroEL
MRPIVDGLKSEYGEQVSFVYLNAADRAEGQSMFERLSLPGHPGSVIFTADGQEVYRGFGVVDESLLRERIEDVIIQQ